MLDTEFVAVILDGLDECGIRFDGCFIDHEGDAHDIETVEKSLADLEAKTNRLRQLLAWAKTMPAAE